jgi:hypothetical protein
VISAAIPRVSGGVLHGPVYTDEYVLSILAGNPVPMKQKHDAG